ncbi:hypothetical protein PENSTE_c005G08017 [Penicillium steckii]|uniref:Uncharacterized protein n=1 Tax=Penicillium steckii TaxID=303698 RepID=A0A1V6TK61_9EURO|nr:hypothetical protein PENSTE_c005G08017 [Penicillium steckii]
MRVIIHQKPPQEDWFAQFPNFKRNPNAKVSDEFQRLGKQRNWRPWGPAWSKYWYGCMDAEYERLIGNRDTSLVTWQQMCAKLGLDANLDSIRKCKKEISRVHVNIVDLIDYWETDQRPRFFKSRRALARNLKTGMRFPLQIAKQNKVIRALLGEAF